MATTQQRVYKSDVHAAKAWAKRHGYEGRQGGWIYMGAKSQRPVVQGWFGLARILRNCREIAPVDPKRPWDAFVIVEA